jgi:plasmid maintenance system antidote protein VapI
MIDKQLRQAIIESGMSQRALSQATGVERLSINRFVNRQRSLRFDFAAVLAEYLGLELQPKIQHGTNTKKGN